MNQTNPSPEPGPNPLTSIATPSSTAAALPELPLRMLWFEVAAVLSLGCGIFLWGAVVSLLHRPPMYPYWLDALGLMILSGCVIVPVLYIMARSDQPWARFGIVWPSLGDVGFAFFLWGAMECFWMFYVAVVPSPEVAFRSATLKTPLDYALLIPKYATAAFMEELVMRAYLITRLETLLKSTKWAVLFAAVAFASYHLYYGIADLGFFVAVGLLYGVAFVVLRRIWPVCLAHLLWNILADLRMVG